MTAVESHQAQLVVANSRQALIAERALPDIESNYDSIAMAGAECATDDSVENLRASAEMLEARVNSLQQFIVAVDVHGIAAQA